MDFRITEDGQTVGITNSYTGAMNLILDLGLKGTVEVYEMSHGTEDLVHYARN